MEKRRFIMRGARARRYLSRVKRVHAPTRPTNAKQNWHGDKTRNCRDLTLYPTHTHTNIADVSVAAGDNFSTKYCSQRRRSCESEEQSVTQIKEKRRGRIRAVKNGKSLRRSIDRSAIGEISLSEFQRAILRSVQQSLVRVL